MILFNIWDAGSAQAIQEIGAKVIATSSWSVAAAHGYEDGEKLPFDLVLANLKRIIASVDLPVTIDLEGGYGKSPTGSEETITKVIEAGAVGINFEDQIIGREDYIRLKINVHVLRLFVKQQSMHQFLFSSMPRTDIFLKTDLLTIMTMNLRRSHTPCLCLCRIWCKRIFCSWPERC